MSDFCWKGMVILLAVAVAAAFTLGQKGIPGEGEREQGGQGTKAYGSIGSGNDAAETENDSAAKGGAGGRVAREGKILQGWETKPCIVVDAGHGGYDPGKIGINEVLEKDVNLKIACLLRDYLEASGVQVVMTRESDCSLGEDAAENKKVQDLKKRIDRIEEAKPEAAVSIHQNSYPQEEICGAQVFYYVTSREGKILAEALQKRLVEEVDPDNRRQVKDNNSYYLLKKTAVPLVIAECGFLSNREEAELLCSEEYQEKVAWALYLGVMDYLEQKK